MVHELSVTSVFFYKRNGGMSPKGSKRSHGTQHFKKNALKIVHFYRQTMSREWCDAGLRRRRTVRYFFPFAVLRASFSFDV